MKIFAEDIISQREDALEFVKEHIRLHVEIKGTERVEKWEYPIEAIREVITNAIIKFPVMSKLEFLMIGLKPGVVVRFQNH